MNTIANIQMLKFEVDFYTVDTSQYVQATCNSLTFINYGTSVVSIESVILQPTQSFTIEGNNGEYTEQKFIVNFGTSSTGNNCVIVRKRYLNV
jgi:hypothetical protein